MLGGLLLLPNEVTHEIAQKLRGIAVTAPGYAASATAQQASSDAGDVVLPFAIKPFDDPETGKPTRYGCFSRNWRDEEAMDVLIDKLEAGQLSHEQALMQARKLEATTPYNLEIQNFIANRSSAGCARPCAHTG